MIVCNGNELKDLDELLVCIESELRKLQKSNDKYICEEFENMKDHITTHYELEIWKVCDNDEREDYV